MNDPVISRPYAGIVKDWFPDTFLLVAEGLLWRVEREGRTAHLVGGPGKSVEGADDLVSSLPDELTHGMVAIGSILYDV